MDQLTAYSFRFVMYVSFGFTLEIVFSVIGIDFVMGKPVHRRVPRRYLEGFVSLYMIPVHGLGLLFLFEPTHDVIRFLPWVVRYVFWGVMIAATESAWGFIYDMILGFYSWDYYAESSYRVFSRGYTLWTLVPFWGVAGLVMEVYSDLMIHLSPAVVAFFS